MKRKIELTNIELQWNCIRNVPCGYQLQYQFSNRSFHFLTISRIKRWSILFGYIGDTSNIVYYAHSSRSFYNCPTTAGTMHNITYMNNLDRELPNYYGEEGMQPTAQHLMKYHPMGPWSAPHQVVLTSHQADTHDQF